MIDEVSADLAPDTEELTSKDFEKDQAVFFGGGQVSSPEAPRWAERIEMFKALAFEADRHVKELEAEMRVVRGQLLQTKEALTGALARSGHQRAALLDIEGRIEAWRDANWVEASEGGMTARAMMACLAAAKRSK